jgi:hypothetical protein
VVSLKLSSDVQALVAFANAVLLLFLTTFEVFVATATSCFANGNTPEKWIVFMNFIEMK